MNSLVKAFDEQYRTFAKHPTSLVMIGCLFSLGMLMVDAGISGDATRIVVDVLIFAFVIPTLHGIARDLREIRARLDRSGSSVPRRG